MNLTQSPQHRKIMESTAENVVLQSTDGIDREPFYIEDSHDILFGWYHSTGGESQSDCVAVICSPVGHEYIHSHRSIRHLADRLALQGIPAIRFDYSGVGDSSGADLDPDRWNRWQANIRIVIDRAKQLSGRKRICLIGIRLGATLAAMVTSETHVDLLVLWNVCISGRRYLREIQAIALTAGQSVDSAVDSLESAGFVMSASTIEALQKVNLLDLEFKVNGRILVMGRDDLAPDKSLSNYLTERGVGHDYMNAPGFADMMAEPQFTVVPTTAIASIANWAIRRCEHQGAQLPRGAQPEQQSSFTFVGKSDTALTIEELCCRQGRGSSLFGILSRPRTTVNNLPVILFFNAGCVHHVGPNRLYVTLARKLAFLGFISYRFDLEGIGDSIAGSSVRENHPYPATAGANAQSTLEYLKVKFGYERFILLGLCSGAHTAFHAGLDVEDTEIPEVILINPLTFHWQDGMSLETTRRFNDMSHYKGSLRKPARWLKLLRGNANLVAIIGVLKSYLLVSLNSFRVSVEEILWSKASTRLSEDLQKLFAMRRMVTFYIADSDPGRDILMADAKRTATKALKAGKMSISILTGADHTFSRLASRMELTEKVAESLAQRYRQDGKPQ